MPFHSGTKKRICLDGGGGRKKKRSCVYNNIMEAKRSKYVSRRILLTGFTLYVALGEYTGPVWVQVPLRKANV